MQEARAARDDRVYVNPGSMPEAFAFAYLGPKDGPIAYKKFRSALCLDEEQIPRSRNTIWWLNKLQVDSTDLATPAEDEDDFSPSEMVLRVVEAQVVWLEQAIDAANTRLEPLTSFVLPGGTEAAARLHVARAAVRHAERAMTAMASHVPTNPQAMAYINRLSDYLFVAARLANEQGRADVKWVPGANR